MRDLDHGLPDIYTLGDALHLFQRRHKATVASGEKAVALNPSYAASKAAVHHMTQILAKELACDHITVNTGAILPVSGGINVSTGPALFERAAQ